MYQSQLSSGGVNSLKYDNYAPNSSNDGGYTNLQTREPIVSQSRPENEFKGSPGKPPRQEQMRTSTDFASISSKYQYGAPAAGPKSEAHTEDSAANRPPIYKPMDY